jgi:hypothetical protein
MKAGYENRPPKLQDYSISFAIDAFCRSGVGEFALPGDQ